MTAAIQWLDKWAERVPGLERVGEGRWRSAESCDISYPAQGHASLSDVEEGSRWFAHRNDIIVAGHKRFPCPGPMFDIGGGNGFVSLGLKRKGIDAIVVEPGHHGAETSAARGLPTVEAAYESLKIPDGSLPGIGLFDVLEHIEADRDTLASIQQALMPGGRLYIAVPAHQILWSDADREAGHFRRYSRQQLVDATTSAGFKVEYSTYYFSPLIPAIYFARVMASRSQPAGQQLVAQSTAAIRREHQLGGAIYSPVRGTLFAMEAHNVHRGRTFPIGASCFVVARKPGG